MPSHRSTKIFEFNSDEIYGRSKFVWETTENNAEGKAPARNIIKFKSGPTFQVRTMLDIIVQNTNSKIKLKSTA